MANKRHLRDLAASRLMETARKEREALQTAEGGDELDLRRRKKPEQISVCWSIRNRRKIQNKIARGSDGDNVKEPVALDPL
jgi:hypothetical protein